jgi:hypothetical protein
MTWGGKITRPWFESPSFTFDKSLQPNQLPMGVGNDLIAWGRNLQVVVPQQDSGAQF